MMVIENKYNIGDLVYLTTDTDQFQRLVIAINILPNNITYGLQCGTDVRYHYDIEISKEKTIIETI